MKEKFYITTPIYYVNDVPHIGHAYTTIAADALARYYRLRGREVFFLTGTDENSQKNVDAAAKFGYDDIQNYLDVMSGKWKDAWRDLKITNNDFIRTTEERHKKGVEKFFKKVWDKGDIYQGEYEGLYCVSCEAFYKESDLIDGCCPIHKTKVQAIKEKNWFFKLTKYRQALLEHIEKNPGFIQPETRRNEVVSYVKNFMEDVSISRASMKWGIPVPTDQTQVLYVWFDALINYLTGIGYGWDDKKFDHLWPAEVHLVGKDIIKFHCALWPAMLLSAELPLPKSVFAHGFFTIDGEKMSKSLGNVVNPVEVADKYGLEPLRYYLLHEIHFGSDGDFSFAGLEQRYNGELANGIGNLTARVLAMTEKYFDGRVPKRAARDPLKHWDGYDRAMESLRLHEALQIVGEIVKDCDELIDREKPWTLAKTDREKLAEVLYTLLETLRHLALMLHPFMPETALKILTQLGLELPTDYDRAKQWGALETGTRIARGEPLFPRLAATK